MTHSTTVQTLPDVAPARSCRFVIGRPLGSETRFCGAPLFEVSYCEEHFHRCYKKPAPRTSIAITCAAWKRHPNTIRRR